MTVDLAVLRDTAGVEDRDSPLDALPKLLAHTDDVERAVKAAMHGTPHRWVDIGDPDRRGWTMHVEVQALLYAKAHAMIEPDSEQAEALSTVMLLAGWEWGDWDVKDEVSELKKHTDDPFLAWDAVTRLYPKGVVGVNEARTFYREAFMEAWGIRTKAL